jgi:hypothetical protein
VGDGQDDHALPLRESFLGLAIRGLPEVVPAHLIPPETMRLLLPLACLATRCLCRRERRHVH